MSAPAPHRAPVTVRATFVLCTSLLGLGLGGCERPPGKELQPGSYRAVVDVGAGRAVPFGLDVAREEQGYVLYLINGEERVRVAEVEARTGQVGAKFAGYENGLVALISGGELTGTLTLVHPDERRLALPFAARLGETWRFHPERRSDNADMAGRWDITFTDASGHTTRAIAELRQRFDQVTGTVIGAADDQRYLAGEVHDEALSLSRFDGGALVLYRGKLDAQGRWVGDAWSDRGGARTFVAVRNPGASVERTAMATQLRNPDEPFHFEFRDLDGRPVTSSDPRFAGKPMLVTLGGSWCPNSHDEAALLVQLDGRYRARGLTIVGLMFEQHAEFEHAAQAIRRFRGAHGIEYHTLVAGTMDRARAAAAVPQLDGVRAYPTTLFVDRTGRVRKIHTGFAGPATGVMHALLAQEFEQTIEALLADDGSRVVPASSTN
jgi:hypothetical protein